MGLDKGKAVFHIMFLLPQSHWKQKKCLNAEISLDKLRVPKRQKIANDPKYQEWKTNHICKINHTGNTNSMEAAGAQRVFERSYATRAVHATKICLVMVTNPHIILLQRGNYMEKIVF